VRRLALVLVAVLALAACGSSGGSSNASDQIKSTYENFFSGKTSISDRVALLQNGPQFKAVVTSFANNPLAKNVGVTVSKVTLEGSDKAKVVYTVKLGGSALPAQTGSAVLQNGKWKVGFASLCRLVALGGTTPAACKKS
jgi:ABC-type glycerol-3-phosphate transport system substrate-binding protein